MSQVNHPNEKGHELIANEIIKWFTHWTAISKNLPLSKSKQSIK